jgi:type IV pilus assembly protein PilB
MNHIIDIQSPPQYLGIIDADLYDKNVIVKKINGERFHGKLKELNGPLQRLLVLSSSSTHNHSLAFKDIRYVMYIPYQNPLREEEYETNLLQHSVNEKHKQRIHVRYLDGETAEGYVLGYIADMYGLQLFREIAPGNIMRIFIPSIVIKSYQIGELLGKIIKDQNIVDQATLDNALERQKMYLSKNSVNPDSSQISDGTGKNPKIGEILQTSGKISDDALHKAIAKKFGLPYINLHDLSVDPILIDLVPASLARKYLLVPVNLQNKCLTIAMEDPSNAEAIHMIQFITGLQTEIVVSSRQGIEEALAVLYDPLQEEDSISYINETTDAPEPVNIQKLGEQKPIVRLTSNILNEAVRRRASDIHIRPSEKQFTLLFRIDGNMIKIRDFAKGLLPGIISRIKILGGMDISEHRIPLDGRTRIIIEKTVVDLRISIIPTVDGESVVIRLLNTKVGIKSMESLDFNPADLTNIRSALNKMHGLILVTGPTGSGKSTTLYSALNEIKDRNLNIITVENPVEYHIEGIEQVQVNNATGLTFARVLRNVLRHDPDVIMIGEIRDEETARIAIQSSLTGHLVLSTLHTNSAVGTITRLKDMNIELYLLAPTLLCILAQRLIKCICPHCSEKDDVPEHILKAFNLDRSEMFYHGKGCDLCNHTGYSGRIAVYELLMVNQKLRDAIKMMESESVLQEIAMESGMTPLAENALVRAREGRITITDVYRISQDS